MATLTESSPSWGARSNGSASELESNQLNTGNRSTPKGPVDTYSAFDLEFDLESGCCKDDYRQSGVMRIDLSGLALCVRRGVVGADKKKKKDVLMLVVSLSTT